MDAQSESVIHCPAGGNHEPVTRKERTIVGYDWMEMPYWGTNEVTRCWKCKKKLL